MGGQSKKWGAWSSVGLRKRIPAIESRSSFEMGLIFDIHINLIMPTTPPLPSPPPCFSFAKVGNPAGEQVGRWGGVLSVNEGHGVQQTPGGWLGGSAAQLEVCWRLKSGSQREVLAEDSKHQAEGTMRRRTDSGGDHR